MRANRLMSLWSKNRISRVAQKPRSYRSLRVEALEGRVVLSGLPDLAMADAGPDPAELNNQSAYVETATVAGEADPTIQAPPGGAGGGDPQDPGAPLMPPSITDFGAYIEEGVLCVTGWVADDKEVGGLTVRFSGELEGKSASVDADGFFEFLLRVPNGFTGVIYAQTTDIDGLDSELISSDVY
jgi:hypothetical protein